MSTIVDSTIGDLPQATTVNPVDLLVMEQAGQAKKVTGQTLVDDLSAAIADVIADLTDDAEMSAASAQAAANAAAQSAAEVQGAANQIQANSGAIDNIRTAQAETLAVLSATDRRLNYIWKKNNGILYDTETLTGSGPVVDVPSGAMDFAELKIVGGMSRKCKNLCPYVTKPKNNFFWIFGGGDTGDGLPLPSGQYVVSYKKSAEKSVFGYVETMPGSNKIVSAAQGTFSFTLTESANIRAWLYFPDNTTVISDAQLELGSIATSYEPYSADLIDAKIDQINSVGRNILPPFYTEITTINGLTVSQNEYGTITVNGTATATTPFYILLKDAIKALLADYVGKSIRIVGCPPGGSNYTYWLTAQGFAEDGININDTGNGVTITVSDISGFDSCQFYFVIANGVTASNLTFKPMITTDLTANYNDFSIYQIFRYQIPAAVQALDGYGIGVSESVYNFIDFSQRKYHKRVGSVDLGSLTWIYKPNYGPKMESIFESQAIEGMVNSYTTNIYSLPSMIQSKYVLLNPNKQYQDNSYGSISAWSTNASSIFVNILVRDNNYTNANEFKSAMSGVMLYFELATDEIIDLSEVLTDFNPITQVEACGSLQLHYPQLDNRYDVAVPSQTDIMVDLSEVL